MIYEGVARVHTYVDVNAFDSHKYKIELIQKLEVTDILYVCSYVRMFCNTFNWITFSNTYYFEIIKNGRVTNITF